MTRKSLIVFLICGIAGAIGFSETNAGDEEGPKYVSTKTKEVIERMVRAHGGLEKWRSSPTVSFHTHLKVNFGGDNWVPFGEEVTAETATRRVYAKLPNADGTYGRIAFDGEKAWSAGNLQGIANAPARFTAWRDFYLFNIPWLTQDSGVILSEAGRGKRKFLDKECITIKMTFETGTGDTWRDYYILFIDPDTFRLRAAEYVMTYASMMQEDAKSSPPSYFVWEKTANIDGLIVPTNYTVYWSEDNSVAVKDGQISNWSFNKPFDESQMEMPSDGEIDESEPMMDDES